MSLGRLLILDDDLAVAQTIAFIAENAGLKTRISTDSTVFFAALDEWPPDYIALDLVMPEMDGVEVMRLLAQRGCSAKVIITSGVGNRVLGAAQRSAEEHGLNVVGVVSKPFSAKVFRALISNDSPRALDTDSPKVNASRLVVTEKKLRAGLDKREFVMVYQPKVWCESGKLAGFEALVRWHHPSGAIILPDVFIPKMEELGLMSQLTEQVLEQALDWFSSHFSRRQWEQNTELSRQHPLSLSVNISAKNLYQLEFADRITEMCIARDIEPGQLIFELTETSATDDSTLSLDLLTRLRVKGFQLSIDDFGTGYSSMVQLVRLPFSEVKVDRSFVMTMLKSQESRTVIKSIVDLGRTLGLRTSAEGVENASSLELLRHIGCDLAQGFYIARPMYGEELLKWLKSRPEHIIPGDASNSRLDNFTQ